MHDGIPQTLIKKVIGGGLYLRGSSLSVKYLQNNDYRFSPVVSKKQGNAPQRNRVKRIIRDYMRGKRKVYPAGHYLIYYNGACESLNREQAVCDLDRAVALFRKQTAGDSLRD